LLPEWAILDQELTLGMTRATSTQQTGIEAMVHAIEAYTAGHKKKSDVGSNCASGARVAFGQRGIVGTDGSNLERDLK